MRTGLIMLVTAATIGTAAIAAPASAQYRHDGYGYGDRHGGGWHHDRWDRRREWRRDHWRHERAWRHHHDDYGYGGYHGRGYYGY